MEASCFMQKFNHKISWDFYIASIEINIFFFYIHLVTHFTVGCSLISGGNSRDEEEEEVDEIIGKYKERYTQ